MLKRMLHLSLNSSVEDCRKSILGQLEKGNSRTKLLDCGCYKGDFTLQIARKIGTKNMSGIEINKEGANVAKQNGIKVVLTDLNKKFPFENHSFDVVTANQVAEHLYDTDHFAREIKRVLKPTGYAVVSTNNLASWHNIVALLLGAQPFPSDVSNTPSVGKLIKLFDGDANSFAHLRVFSFRALKEFFILHGFEIVESVGVGYYPFSGKISASLSRLDKRHSVYSTLKIRPLK